MSDADAATSAAEVQRHALDAVGRMFAERVQVDGKITAEAVNSIQPQAMALARLLAEQSAASAFAEYAAAATPFEQELSRAYSADVILHCAKELQFGSLSQTIDEKLVNDVCALVRDLSPETNPEVWQHLGKTVVERERDLSGDRGLKAPHTDFLDMFARFADSVIAPLAERIHREDEIIPDDILSQIAGLGAFGISIPEEYGGNFVDHLVMVIATEELSRASLGAGGSVLTRPEICAKALLAGGTEEQKKKWLPVIASGSKMVCVAVTEPNTGSDVANVSVTASKTDGGYRINGEKTWATFAGRSEILCLLARTGPSESGHKGLSLFLVEKPYEPEGDQYRFRHEQPAGGIIEGKAIPTIGYRGMHSFSVSFDNYFVPEENLIGEEGKGFYLQMQGFSGGRIQTAARALGVMEASFRAAVNYAQSRKLFGQHLSDFGLTRWKFGRMAATIQANRQLAYRVANRMDSGEGGTEASLVKLLACKDAEWVTREAMQLHGGMGYSEEYPVSRYFLDARVLSIFEGAEEVLALQVIVRPFLQGFLHD